MKTEIAGLTISYSTVTDLNEKMQKAFGDIAKELAKVQAQQKTLLKQKKEIAKFLGIKSKKKDVGGETPSSASA